jgi:acetyltransferase-like isoleucine patch superfamily enzyme
MSEFKSFGKNSIIDRPLTIRGAKYISIGKNVLIGRRVVLTAFDAYLNKKFTPEIIISDDVEIGDDSHITCLNNIYIGKGVLTGKKILITDNAHGLFIESDLAIEPKNRIPVSKGAVVIEDYVWIGEKASIMPGVTVGRGAIIGANAVVTKNIPPYSIAAGCPATIVKQLSKHDCCHSVKKK